MAEKKIDADNRRQNLSFFHLMFPAVLLAIISFIPNCSSSVSFGITVIIIVVKLLLVIWQGVALKNFIESTL